MVELNDNEVLQKKYLKHKNIVSIEDPMLHGKYYFYKENNNSIIWSVDRFGYIGELLFSFDKKRIYNLWQDYPYNMTKEEIEIFNKEQHYWRDFFASRLGKQNSK